MRLQIVGSDMSIMCTNMEKEGNSALKWNKDNYLPSNPEKLNTIGIKRRNETEQINIKIGDQAIKTTDNIKLLGVNFDENLIFSQHVTFHAKTYTNGFPLNGWSRWVSVGYPLKTFTKALEALRKPLGFFLYPLKALRKAVENFVPKRWKR